MNHGSEASRGGYSATKCLFVLFAADLPARVLILGVRKSMFQPRSSDQEGTQIDLLVSRMDNVINMCEIKFYSDLFTVDGDYYRTVMRRQALLEPHLKRGMGIRNTLIITYGLAHNKNSGVFTNTVTLDDLFEGC